MHKLMTSVGTQNRPNPNNYTTEGEQKFLKLTIGGRGWGEGNLYSISRYAIEYLTFPVFVFIVPCYGGLEILMGKSRGGGVNDRL